MIHSTYRRYHDIYSQFVPLPLLFLYYPWLSLSFLVMLFIFDYACLLLPPEPLVVRVIPSLTFFAIRIVPILLFHKTEFAFRLILTTHAALPHCFFMHCYHHSLSGPTYATTHYCIVILKPSIFMSLIIISAGILYPSFMYLCTVL